jgi:hypothetical protein
MLADLLTLHNALVAGAGYLLGAFTPGVLRKIRAFIIKEDTALEARVKALEAKIVAGGLAEIKKA